MVRYFPRGAVSSLGVFTSTTFQFARTIAFGSSRPIWRHSFRTSAGMSATLLCGVSQRTRTFSSRPPRGSGAVTARRRQH